MSRKRILKHTKHSLKSVQHKPKVGRWKVDKKGDREKKKRRKSRKGKFKIWQENRDNYRCNNFINFRNYNCWNDVY